METKSQATGAVPDAHGYSLLVPSCTFSPSTTSTSILPPKVMHYRWKSLDLGDKSSLVWDLVCPDYAASVISHNLLEVQYL